MRLWIGILVCGSACATAHICPDGAQLATAMLPSGRTESCAKSSGGGAELPASGRSYEGALGTAQPARHAGGLDGPSWHWYPDGAIESHGAYVDAGDESLADGVWAFWYRDGSRRLVGRYSRGVPIGCFQTWDEQGIAHTGFVEGTAIREAPCRPPDPPELVALEAAGRPHDARPLWGDVGVLALADAGALGVHNSAQVVSDPRARWSLDGVLHKYFGRLRVGVSLGYQRSDSSDGHAYKAGALVGYNQPIARALFAEIDGTVALEYLSLVAERKGMIGFGDVSFMTPLVGARASLVYALGASAELVASFGIDVVPSRSATVGVDYCESACFDHETETWTLGATTIAAGLGVRGRIR